jgi:hypothetical protein
MWILSVDVLDVDVNMCIAQPSQASQQASKLYIW